MHALGELISSLGELIGQLIENLIGAISALLQALGVEERVADPLSGLLIVGSIVLGLGGTYFYVVNTPKFAVERVCSSLITRNNELFNQHVDRRAFSNQLAQSISQLDENTGACLLRAFNISTYKHEPDELTKLVDKSVDDFFRGDEHVSKAMNELRFEAVNAELSVVNNSPFAKQAVARFFWSEPNQLEVCLTLEKQNIWDQWRIKNIENVRAVLPKLAQFEYQREVKAAEKLARDTAMKATVQDVRSTVSKARNVFGKLKSRVHGF